MFDDYYRMFGKCYEIIQFCLTKYLVTINIYLVKAMKYLMTINCTYINIHHLLIFVAYWLLLPIFVSRYSIATFLESYKNMI